MSNTENCTFILNKFMSIKEYNDLINNDHNTHEIYEMMGCETEVKLVQEYPQSIVTRKNNKLAIEHYKYFKIIDDNIIDDNIIDSTHTYNFYYHHNVDNKRIMIIMVMMNNIMRIFGKNLITIKSTTYDRSNCIFNEISKSFMKSFSKKFRIRCYRNIKSIEYEYCTSNVDKLIVSEEIPVCDDHESSVYDILVDKN